MQQLTAKKDPQAPELQKKNAMWITAYLGEVIRRETGATWYDYEDRPLLDCGDYQADPMTAVIEFFEQRQEPMKATSPSKPPRRTAR